MNKKWGGTFRLNNILADSTHSFQLRAVEPGEDAEVRAVSSWTSSMEVTTTNNDAGKGNVVHNRVRNRIVIELYYSLIYILYVLENLLRVYFAKFVLLRKYFEGGSGIGLFS